jgi:hypothetical protein
MSAKGTDVTSGDRNAHQLTASDHTAQITGSGVPLHKQKNKIESDEPTTRPRSERIAQKRWLIAQTKLRKRRMMAYRVLPKPQKPPPEARPDPTSDNPELLSTGPLPIACPKPMFDVFNVPELLEQTLLHLETYFIIRTAQNVCRGFKQSMDPSPAFRKRRNFAFHIVCVDDEDTEQKDRWAYFLHTASRPMSMNHRFEASNTLRLYFPMDNAAFQKDTATESFRRLRVFDKRPQRITFDWIVTDPSFQDGIWEVKDEDSEITFGQILDVMAGLQPCEATAYHVWIHWSEDANLAHRSLVVEG